MMERKVIIVGGGIAGAATAWALAEAGLGEVLLLDAGSQPGTHATGRNAAILRSAIPDPELHALARASAAFYRTPPLGFAEAPLLDPVGLILSAPEGPEADELEAWLTTPGQSEGGQEIPWSAVQARHPYLRQDPMRAWSFPEEGVLDVHAVLHGFLRLATAAGVQVRLRSEVTSLIRDDARVLGVRIGEEELFAETVVLAEGGWAGRLLPDLPTDTFLPRRRHLVVSGPDPAIDPRAPVVWISGAQECYFRPESGGMLLSACDHAAVPPDQGELLDHDVLSLVAEKALHWLPGLEAATAAHAWAGMRTFCAEPGFRVGPDPDRPGLFWVAGLGGHGISCAPAVGREAAALLLGADRGIDHDLLLGTST